MRKWRGVDQRAAPDFALGWIKSRIINEVLMRLTLTSTLAAAALALPQLAPSYVHAQPASPRSAESIAAIHDGKTEVNGVLYHYLLAKGPRLWCCCTDGVRLRICGDL